MNDETGWLIEKDNIEWWTGSGWTQDSYEAVRFARKEDAERVIFGFPAIWAVKAKSVRFSTAVI